MDKLVERETATRNPLVAAPALAVQFFLIPLAVVGVAVLLYSGFRSLLADDRTPQDYLAEVQIGGSNRRWPAAYELSRLMADPKVRADRDARRRRWSTAFDEAKDDDPRMRQYLALAIGRLDPPLPAEGGRESDERARRIRTARRGSARSGRSARRAIRRSCRRSSRSTNRPTRASEDGGLRARRAAGRGADRRRCGRRSRTRSPTSAGTRRSRWRGTASREGVPVLQQMLDRAYVEQAVNAVSAQNEDVDPVADVMISGLRAAAVLKRRPAARVGRRAEPAGSQHESAPGGARSTEGDGDA